MFRTRDFVLLFTIIVFLVVSIGATLLLQWTDQGTRVAVPDFTDMASTSPDTYPAIVVAAGGLDRAARVAQMRDKIAKQTIVIETPAVEDQATSSEETGDPATDEPIRGLVACAYTSEYLGFWDARDLSWIDSEGARVLVRGEISSTSIPVPVLQLPKRIAASNNPTCIGSDVIGVANDGSLIRNDEAAVYRIFGVTTVVGYALDGLPIYGGDTAKTDSCGGATVAGQYGYYLSTTREAVINCFAAPPVALP